METNHTSRHEDPRIEDRLAGRARWVIAFCACGCLLGSIIGYRAAKPVYRAQSLLQLKPALSQAGDDGATRFEAFASKQVAAVMRRDVLEPAMYRSRFAPADFAGFARRVKVQRDGDTVAIAFEHTDPHVAADAAEAIAKVYLDAVPSTNVSSLRRTHAQLQRHAQELNDAYAVLRNKQAESGGDTQLHALHQRHEYLLARRNNIEQDLEHVQTILVEAGAANATALIPEVSNAQRATMVQQRNTLAAEIEQMELRFGSQYPALRQHRAELAKVEQWFNANPPALPRAMDVPDPAGDLAAVRQRKVALTELHKDINTKIEQVVAQAAALIKMDQAREALQRKARDAEAAVLAFEESAAFTGQIAQVGRADVPATAVSDGRVSTAAFMGAIGALIGFAMTLLLGPAPTPVRRAADLSDDLPLLGVLPTMTDELDDSETATAAALCVHNLRNMMQLTPAAAEGAQAFAVTSASDGAGKTSVSLALGLSFAASGHRTLLIDADFAGHGLTQRADTLGTDHATGLLAALEGCRAAECTIKTAVPNLAILGLDDATASDAHRLSAVALKNILKQVRSSYDVILIDTPTATGHVETPVVAAESDAVLTVVTRGEDLRHVRETLSALSRLGAKAAGLIFNHAPANDVENLTPQRIAA